MTERTDRELLELAAKAAGHDYSPAGYIVVDGIPGNWNPLEDDGDALRLAVKLGFTVEVEGAETRNPATIIHCAKAGGEILWERHGARPKHATRRAVVRAAAAMAEGGEYG